jgi:hypothetical protein
LKRLGVAQVGDGVAALPADARTREQLEWVADDVEQAGGTAVLWTATPSSRGQERRLAEEMQAARAGEYAAVRQEAETARIGAALDRAGALRRLRAELRRIERRDYFPPEEKETARAAVGALAAMIADESGERV